MNTQQMTTLDYVLLGSGAAAAASPTLIHDTFTDTNGTSLSAHTIAPTNTVAASWVLPTGVTPATIESNTARVITDDWKGPYVESGIANGTITVDHNDGTDGALISGILFRYVDNSNFLMMAIRDDLDNMTLYKMEAGSLAVVVASGAVTIATSTTYALKVILNGTSIKGYVDGALLVDTTNSFNQSATKHGLAARPGGYPQRYWDNFKITNETS